MKINVHHLGSQVTQASLECIFETYGRVEESSIFDKTVAQSGTDCRCAEIVMPDAGAAAHAVRSLNGSFVNGLQWQVSFQ